MQHVSATPGKQRTDGAGGRLRRWLVHEEERARCREVQAAPPRRNNRPAPLSAGPWRPERSIRPRVAARRLLRRHRQCGATPHPGSAKVLAGHPADRAPFGSRLAVPRDARQPASRPKRRSLRPARQSRPGTRVWPSRPGGPAGLPGVRRSTRSRLQMCSRPCLVGYSLFSE